ncbi:MAG: hypothetical protein ACTHOU_11225, partial [Aureliella sp.]
PSGRSHFLSGPAAWRPMSLPTSNPLDLRFDLPSRMPRGNVKISDAIAPAPPDIPPAGAAGDFG